VLLHEKVWASRSQKLLQESRSDGFKPFALSIGLIKRSARLSRSSARQLCWGTSSRLWPDGIKDSSQTSDYRHNSRVVIFFMRLGFIVEMSPPTMMVAY
jgi:hypothetical protein